MTDGETCNKYSRTILVGRGSSRTRAAPGNLAVLGATGTIGEQTLQVVRQHRDKFRVISLAAKQSASRLIELAQEFEPEIVAIEDPKLGDVLERSLRGTCRVVAGPGAATIAATAENVQTVVGAIVGFAGSEAILAAIAANKHIALANKESLVSCGELVRRAVITSGSVIVPVDSEHSSLFQVLEKSESPAERLILTASGGPLYFADERTISQATPSVALKHPTWNMGRKISIDSATLMNKGLEVIEARWLFDHDPRRIDVFIHPTSTVHGMVQYADGTSILVAAVADMRLPIAYALGYLWSEDPLSSPGPRLAAGVAECDFSKLFELKFFPLDELRFPAVKLCKAVLQQGGTAPAMLNAANEVLVEAFLAEKLPFRQIVSGVEKVLERVSIRPVQTFADILEADGQARELAAHLIESGGFPK